MKSFVVFVKPPQGLSAARRDVLAQFLVALGQRFGLQGMQDWVVELDPSQKVLGVESEFHDLSRWRDQSQHFALYFARARRAQDFVKLLRASMPELKIDKARAAPQVDWVKRWKRFYKPVAVRANLHTAYLWVLPAWKKRTQRRGEIHLRIKPGQAFGTGTHPTTQLCLELFLGVSYRGLPKSVRVLDFGAGTGILAIAALLWAKREKRKTWASCVEIDKAAHSLLKENLRLNRVNARTSKVFLGGQYNLVFANVLAPVLLLEQKRLWQSVKPGGFLILSGILAKEVSAFLRDFLPGEKFQQRGLKRSGDWVAVLLQKL